ncbi:MAG: 23S rRNA (pseudouridine(1915)-N(3))-methyltransferase RlmH [Bacteroidota bacterium]
MNITLIAIGKTDNALLRELIQTYTNRLGRYVNFEWVIIPDIKNSKNMTESQQRQMEGENLLKRLQPADRLVLLDEKGKEYTSLSFATSLQQHMNSGIKRLVFVIGGPYGFSPQVYEKATAMLSLSKMTFSHQMVRLFAVEQIYRAFTILRNEPYHHR